MARLKGRPRHIRGWVDGVVEGPEPDLAQPQGTFPRGTLDAATNVIATPAGRLAVRRGSQVKLTLHTAAGANVQRVLGVWPFTQGGAVAVGHTLSGGVPETNLYRLTAELAFLTGSEATSRHALTWPTNTTGVPRPVLVELFENMYVVDAQTDYTLRNALQKMTSAGVVSSPTHTLDGVTAAGIKGYCAAAYNGVLFVAGYDSSSGGEEKAMLRHSYLGVDPGASNGFDKDAYAIIGAKGQRITAMAAGRQILLVAKANELYRVTGTGRALPGWQYTIQQVENTQGVGVSNPYALCFAEGYWWGVGETGPFRTNGTTVEPLVAARAQSWRQVQNLRTAWVAYWPDRRVVKFGFNIAPVDSGRSTTYPFVVWNWDIDNECWTGDDRFSADIHFAQAIPTLTASATVAPAPVGPSANPSAVASNIASSTTSSVAVTWTNGDTTAQTEVWLRDESGASTLYSIETAAAASKTITGLAPGRIYSVKVRHVKAGFYSSFTSEATAYTLLPNASVTFLSATDGDGDGTYHVEFAVGGIGYRHPSTQVRVVGNWGIDATLTISEAGATIAFDGVPGSSSVSVTWTNSSWPVSYQASATPAVLTVTSAPAPALSAPTVSMSNPGMCGFGSWATFHFGWTETSVDRSQHRVDVYRGGFLYQTGAPATGSNEIVTGYTITGPTGRLTFTRDFEARLIRLSDGATISTATAGTYTVDLGTC